MSVFKVKKLRPSAIVPKPQTAGAAGADMHACIDEAVSIAPGERKLIPSGLAFAVPPGFELQVRPRSGLALKFGLTVLNSPGTIDSDYRGEVGVVLINHGQEIYTVEPESRIAQLVLKRVEAPLFTEVDELDETTRGSGGYGSTGVSS